MLTLKLVKNNLMPRRPDRRVESYWRLLADKVELDTAHTTLEGGNTTPLTGLWQLLEITFCVPE
jgi:hypothetical protein